jgi:quinohemoprotein ethanol dehydrogenase
VGARADRLRAGWDHNRGIGYWNGKVYVATWDGRLNAIDARTGRELWSVTTIDPELAMYITGAPKVFKGKVLIGNGGTEHGPSRGYVTAYDAETGEQAWRFWIVPGNPADGFEDEAMRMAAETWTGEWWLHGGGGNAWHGFTYDAELDQLYIGTGNGSPWNRKIRSPDGATTSSCLDRGARSRHGRVHLALPDHARRDVGLQLEHGHRARRPRDRGPRSPGDPARAQERLLLRDRPHERRLISAEPFVETTWATRIDLETGRPVEVPGARYEDGPALVSPTPLGGHNWHAMSYNPETGLAYYPAIHLTMRFSDQGIDVDSWRSTNWLGGTGVSWTMAGTTGPGGVASTLQAWDPVRQELAWEVPLPGIYSAGTLTTAGNLVFQGRLDGTFVAYAADTGQELWSTDLGFGISAPPISYSVDGRQYVALLVGWGGAMAGLGGGASANYGWAYGVHTRMLVAFSLEGTGTLPDQPPPYVPEPIAAEFEIDPTLAGQGAAVFGLCGNCHGPGAVSAGMAPDLRASSAVLDAELFRRIVRDGARSGQGMPRYQELSDEMLEALRHYIRQRAAAGLRPTAE